MARSFMMSSSFTCPMSFGRRDHAFVGYGAVCVCRVSITIEAAIETGVVGADVYTFNTATNVSLVFIFLCGNRVACESFY